ncbi:hypothetical protein B9Z55_010265 [Caenorhabditis nigoni]|uniref:Uncharacterized protein n=1 Tax=Caenorhabditis nigoni TaxID=1611254 RepID=A0A2G5UF26_9PELO|nr:hypothetical protein B9Z55_010265 [Caenorhabditis nigoni]
MEVSRHCEEKQYHESREQMAARKQKRRELQEKFAKERKERRREKERIKMEEGRGRKYETRMKRKKEAEQRLTVTKILKEQEKFEQQEENFRQWTMLQQGDSSEIQKNEMKEDVAEDEKNEEVITEDSVQI